MPRAGLPGSSALVANRGPVVLVAGSRPRDAVAVLMRARLCMDAARNAVLIADAAMTGGLCGTARAKTALVAAGRLGRSPVPGGVGSGAIVAQAGRGRAMPATARMPTGRGVLWNAAARRVLRHCRRRVLCHAVSGVRRSTLRRVQRSAAPRMLRRYASDLRTGLGKADRRGVLCYTCAVRRMRRCWYGVLRCYRFLDGLGHSNAWQYAPDLRGARLLSDAVLVPWSTGSMGALMHRGRARCSVLRRLGVLPRAARLPSGLRCRCELARAAAGLRAARMLLAAAFCAAGVDTTVRPHGAILTVAELARSVLPMAA